MSLAACYLLSLECDAPGCAARHRGSVARWDSPDSERDCQTYIQARNEARKVGWILPDAHWAHDKHNPVLCPDCKVTR